MVAVNVSVPVSVPVLVVELAVTVELDGRIDDQGLVPEKMNAVVVIRAVIVPWVVTLMVVASAKEVPVETSAVVVSALVGISSAAAGIPWEPCPCPWSFPSAATAPPVWWSYAGRVPCAASAVVVGSTAVRSQILPDAFSR